MKNFLITAIVIALTAGLGFTLKSIAQQNQSEQTEEKIQYHRTIEAYDETSYVVNLTIEKGDITGTAKVQETIPEGFAVEFGDEVANALTTANGTSVKFLWENLPNQTPIQISYTVFKNGKHDKELTIGGYFLYLVDDIANKKISDPTSFTFNDGKIEIIELNDKDKEKYLEKQNDNIDPSDLPKPEEEVKEELVIKDFSAPADIDENSTTIETESVENIEEGFTEDETNNSEINLTQDENGINYPENAGTNANSEFNQNTEVENAESLTDIVTENNNPSEATLEVDNSSNPTSAAVAGVSYKVQVCALQGNPVSPGYFNEKHNIVDEIFQETHEGWTKYTTGNFNVYKGGRDYRESLRDNHSVIGPFVTAYNNGERITVQEALMLSKQKWYQ